MMFLFFLYFYRVFVPFLWSKFHIWGFFFSSIQDVGRDWTFKVGTSTTLTSTTTSSSSSLVFLFLSPFPHSFCIFSLSPDGSVLSTRPAGHRCSFSFAWELNLIVIVNYAPSSSSSSYSPSSFFVFIFMTFENI